MAPRASSTVAAKAARPTPPRVLPRPLARDPRLLAIRQGLTAREGPRYLRRAAPLPLQRRLAVGASDDPAEHAADRLAEQAMRGQVGAAASGGRAAARFPAPPSVHAALAAPGRTMEAGTRAFFEDRFGADLGAVRIHDDTPAHASARDVGAQAYTVGGDIVFGAGRYRPASDTGRHLLAHEIAHVVQQGAAAPRDPAGVTARTSVPPAQQDRATLRRRVIADVLTTSVSGYFTDQLTGEELRGQIALVTGALSDPGLSEPARATLLMNLQALEDEAAARGMAAPAATAYHLRDAIRGLGADVLRLMEPLRDVVNTELGGFDIGADFSVSSFKPEVAWDVDQLGEVTTLLGDAMELTAQAEAAADPAQSANLFRQAGARVTAALYRAQAVAVHLAYVRVSVAAAKEVGAFADQKLAQKPAMVREIMQQGLAALYDLRPENVAAAAAALQDKTYYGFAFDFSSYVDDLEEAVHKQIRFRQWVGIAMLALTAWDLAAPLGGLGGGGARPPIGGGGAGFAFARVGGGAAMAEAAAGTVEWAETLRRLVQIGAVSSAVLGHVGGGKLPADIGPPAPPQGMAAQAGAGGGGASWGELEAQAEAAPRGQKTGTFGAQTAKSGPRKVTVIEGEVGPPAADAKLVAKARRSGTTLRGEHATHGVGAQLGENLPEGLTSGPASNLNLSLLKQVENATRSTFEAAREVGATVETRTTLRIEQRTVGGETVDVLVGVRRQAWIRNRASQATTEFLDFEAAVDPATRAVTVLRDSVLRPPP